MELSIKAGVFDSGVGGLTVVKSLLQNKIFEQIIYFGDTARVPYGTKDKDTIVSYSLEALKFFETHDIDILIIACNSASAYALTKLQQIAKIPVIGVIDSGVLAVKNHIKKDANILIIGTSATINSNLYEKGLKEYGFLNIASKATPLLVPLVEENILEGNILDETFKHYFHDFKNIDTVILGCTHFPLLEKQLSKYFNGAKTIHSGDAIIEYLQTNYNCTKQYKHTKIEFFASSSIQSLKKTAKLWLQNLI